MKKEDVGVVLAATVYHHWCRLSKSNQHKYTLEQLIAEVAMEMGARSVADFV